MAQRDETKWNATHNNHQYLNREYHRFCFFFIHLFIDKQNGFDLIFFLLLYILLLCNCDSIFWYHNYQTFKGTKCCWVSMTGGINQIQVYRFTRAAHRHASYHNVQFQISESSRMNLLFFVFCWPFVFHPIFFLLV